MSTKAGDEMESTFNIDVCIDIMFSEYDRPSRIARCADLGIDHVEFWDWRPHDLRTLKSVLERFNASVITFSGLIGHEHPITDPKMKKSFLDFLRGAAVFASKLNVDSLIVSSCQEITGKSKEQQWKAYVGALQEAAGILKKHNVTVLLEPLNRSDRPGSFLYSLNDALQIIKEVDGKVKILFDLFDVYKEEKGISKALENCREHLGHIHIADVPERHEPGTGVIDWKMFVKTLQNRIMMDTWNWSSFLPRLRNTQSQQR